MNQHFHRVVSFEIVGSYTLRVEFEDGTSQTIDFRPVLAGELYGPLRDLDFFEQVEIDHALGTLVWPNEADFNPNILHDWPDYAREFERLAREWGRERAVGVRQDQSDEDVSSDFGYTRLTSMPSALVHASDSALNGLPSSIGYVTGVGGIDMTLIESEEFDAPIKKRLLDYDFSQHSVAA